MSNFVYVLESQDASLNKPEDIRQVIERVEIVDGVDVEDLQSKLNELSEEKAGTAGDEDDDEDDDNFEEDEDDEDEDDEEGEDVEVKAPETNKASVVEPGESSTLKEQTNVTVLQKPVVSNAEPTK